MDLIWLRLRFAITIHSVYLRVENIRFHVYYYIIDLFLYKYV